MLSVCSGSAPLSRARPSLVTLDHEVFVLCGVAAGKPLSTVAMLDTQMMAWSSPLLDGVAPTPRMGASATRVGTEIFLFGGSDGRSSLNDLHALVYVTWFSPDTNGREPRPRVGHTCTCLGNVLYVLGGAAEGHGLNELFTYDPTTQVGACAWHGCTCVLVRGVLWHRGDEQRARWEGCVLGGPSRSRGGCALLAGEGCAGKAVPLHPQEPRGALDGVAL